MTQRHEGSAARSRLGKAVPNNLVPALTSFVGREADIHAIRGLVEGARLVSVTGPPGAGKTRVASEVADRLLAVFDEGVWFVGLAPITEPGLVLSTIADVLNVRPATDRPLVDALSAELKDRRVLLVLDNFEHVLDATKGLGQLLTAAPSLHVLVTSRALLHLSGEHEYALRPFEVPRPDAPSRELERSEAVELFTRRAVTSLPTFRLDEKTMPLAGELCRRLDGLPLAIELAAARARLLPLPAILARLDHRLALLTGGPSDLPVRQQSLRAAVAWSCDLLEPPAQALFRRLSVFRGGWTIDGAIALSDDPSNQDAVFDTVASLFDTNLPIWQVSEATPRFTMLETLREFAADRLEEAGETDWARRRHAALHLELVEREKLRFTGPERGTALDAIAIDHDNIRAALAHLIERRDEDGLRLAAGMWRFWQMRGYLVEGSRWLEDALRAAGDGCSAELRADAQAAAGGLAYWRGDIAETTQHYESALALRRDIGEDLGVADALYDLAFVYQPEYSPPPVDPERTARAVALVGEAQDVYRRSGNEAGLAKTGWMMGNLLLQQDSPEAKAVLGASVERFRKVDDPFGLGWALYSYGLACLGCSDAASAGQAFGEALELSAAAGDGSALGLLLEALGEVAIAEGDALRATRLRAAAASNRQTTEADIAFVNPPWSKDNSTRMTDAAALEAAWSEGQAMSQAEAIAYALARDREAEPEGTLRVSALGSTLVERAGRPVTKWGGPKAGSRQAQAMFAFLLDRGEHGVTKDEFIDVIWPDAELEQGDLNFHRTLGGLRATLQSDKADAPIVFGNGRYRMKPTIVGWLDVVEFEQRLSNAAHASDGVAAIHGLEAARALYRGDYLEDCPFYGDSEYVEERRRLLRGRLVDALVDLGRRYEARGDGTLAAARFREALMVAGDDCPSASEGLDRLGVPI